MKAATKPLRAVDVQAKASEGRKEKISGGLISRDLRKLLEKGEARQNADKTWEAVKVPKTPTPQAEKSQVTTEAPAQTKEVRVRINVTKGAETGHHDSGVDGPYTNAEGHDINTKKGCKKCSQLLQERRAASQPEAGPSKAEMDDLVLDTLEKVDNKSPLFVAMALGRAGKITVTQMPLVMESFRRLAKDGRLKKT